ncbi:hypothetical protein B0O80DRAFT_425810 [Mortierella sp. GBAus27b]|nr:hypothetical protein BGX31_009217 [Mortierella sp. GBA43]KAI8355305.1 hypothetical protein B0O80DRAFT_425810 [Mortierella sp. GBAus27b]
MYTTNNFRYLRISKTIALPLNLLLSKEDLEWFNDYSFQEILTVLKPLLLSRVQLHDQGRVVKRTIAPTTFVNVHQDWDDGLEDAGIVLGGSDHATGNQGSVSVSSESTGNNTDANSRKRKGKGKEGASSKAPERPLFSIRYGMRPSTVAECGGGIMSAEKDLGFLRVKTEQGDDDTISAEESSSQRIRKDLASLEGEGRESAGDGDMNSVVIREEDESENLRVSDFQRGDDGGSDDGHGNDQDDDYVEQPGNKRKTSAKETRRQGKGKRAKADEQDAPSNQVDQKPTLQIKYAPLRLHPQTLYIVVHTMGTAGAPTPGLSTSANVAATSAPEVESETGDVTASEQPQEEEDSLFPPGLDNLIP